MDNEFKNEMFPYEGRLLAQNAALKARVAALEAVLNNIHALAEEMIRTDESGDLFTIEAEARAVLGGFADDDHRND